MSEDAHYGCPKCASKDFHTTQDVTQYGTEVVHCTFTSSEPDGESDYEITDYGDFDTTDSETGDVDDNKTCADCGHEYTTPTHYGPANTVEEIAERSNLPLNTMKSLAWLFATLSHASIITVQQEPHALLIDATSRTIKKGSGNHSWTVYSCSRCNAELEHDKPRTRQAYQPNPASYAGRDKVYDNRQLPVIVKANLCAQCA